MGVQRVLWMLALTFSTSWKAQVNTAGKSTYHHDGLSYKDVIVESLHCPLLLTTHYRQQTAPSNSSKNAFIGSAAVMYGVVNTQTRMKGMHMKSLMNLKLQNTRDASMLSPDEASLSQMLVAVVKKELRECDLVLAYDAKYNIQTVLQDLLLLQNQRQVVLINITEDFTRIMWKSPVCRGYLFLLDNPEPLLTFASTYHDTWDYSGRVVVVGLSLEHLVAFVESYKGKRTEHVVGAVKSGTEGDWVLYMNQLYWGQGVRRINTWYHHTFTSQLDLFPDKLSNLQGAVLKVSTFMYEPCIFLRRAENGTVVSRYGVDIDVVSAVARVLNSTLQYRETPTGETWGEKLENGSWFGLMGQLQRNEVDIGLANLFVSSHWLEVLDLTAPYTSEITCFMTRLEPPLPHWQALAFPFHKWTWLAVLAGLIVSGPLLFLLAWCSNQCGGEIRSLQSLSFSWYYAFGLHFSEGHVSLPRKTSTQIFVMFLWLYTMILTIVYSTNLMSFLLLRKQPAMMETFKDLYESGLEVASLGVLFKDGLAFASDPYLKGLTRVFKWYDEQEKIFPLLLQGKAVYLGNRKTLEFLLTNKFSKRGVPRVRIMKEYYAPYSVAMALQRHSPLKRKFDQLMGWIQQGGLVRHFFLDSLRRSASYEKDGNGGKLSEVDQEEVAATDGVIPLSLDHMQGLFLITGIGWFFCVLTFILEKTIFSD